MASSAQSAVRPESTSSATRKPARKRARKPKIREFLVEVVEIEQETPDTVTLYFAKADPEDPEHGEPWDYEAGQFCTVRPHEFPALGQQVAYFEEVKGKREPARAYSLATAPHEPHVGITVKEEHFYSGESKYPPLLSPYLVYGVTVGTRLTIQGFGGPYTYPENLEERTDHVVHLVSGSGSVPNYGLIKHALHEDLAVRHTMLYSNKTWADVIYRDQLAELEAVHPDRLRVYHAITREEDPTGYGPRVRKGRFGREALEELVPDLTEAEIYLCGSGITKWDRLAAKETGVEPAPKFIEGMMALLDEMGVSKGRLHKESW